MFTTLDRTRRLALLAVASSLLVAPALHAESADLRPASGTAPQTAARSILATPAADIAALKGVARASSWDSLITADRLAERLAVEPGLVLIDARSPKQYAEGHLPGAINLPGESMRTPNAKPGQGDSQYVFRTPDGGPDVALYERLLGNAGLTRDAAVVVYGDHAGKADGSVPAMLLDWLGQRDVAFLDGVGVDQWTATGRTLSTEPTTLPPATYRADAAPDFVWNLPEVLDHLGDGSVVFYDTRTPDEFAGTEAGRRGNAHGGHIPGAVELDYASFLADNKTTLSKEELKSTLEANGVTPDKTVVLYCQTATRVSLPYLVLKDLGYPKVAVYDASWHEYGNRDDTPKETGN